MRRTMRRVGVATVTIAVAFALAFVSATSGCRRLTERGAGAVPVSSSPAAVMPSPFSAADAPLALWKRTLAAGRDVSAQVDVTETRYPTPAALAAGTAPIAITYTAIEGAPPTPRAGQPPHYRLEYVSPARLAGVVLLSNGSAVWRYDPRDKIAGRHGADTAPTPPELEEGVAGVPAEADGARPEIESTGERVAGRPTAVLALRRTGSGRTLERRWVDVETGRTLRWEQYAGRDAYLARRVEITQIAYLTTPAQLADTALRLRPDFPVGTRQIDRRPLYVRHVDEAEAAAGAVHLPLHVRGFSIRGVKRAMPPNHLASKKPTAAAEGKTPTQLFYSNGEQAISVFVTPSNRPTDRPADAVAGSALPLPSPSLESPPQGATPQTGGWHPLNLDNGRVGYTREMNGGAAVAWSAPEGSFVAVSRMPLPRLLPIAAAFAADRDDAPEQRLEPHSIH